MRYQLGGITLAFIIGLTLHTYRVEAAPVISALYVDEAAGELLAFGSFEASGNTIRVNGIELPTLFESDTLIRATIPLSGSSSVGVVTVENLGNGSPPRILTLERIRFVYSALTENPPIYYHESDTVHFYFRVDLSDAARAHGYSPQPSKASWGSYDYNNDDYVALQDTKGNGLLDRSNLLVEVGSFDTSQIFFLKIGFFNAPCTIQVSTPNGVKTTPTTCSRGYANLLLENDPRHGIRAAGDTELWNKGFGIGGFTEDTSEYLLEVPGSTPVTQNLSIYPNPTRLSATIELQLDHTDAVEFDLFDLYGRKLQHISRNDLQAGLHEFRLTTAELASGEYILRSKVGGAVATRKLTVLH